MNKKVFILIIFTMIMFSEIFCFNGGNDMRDYNLIYQEWKKQIENKNTISDFEEIPISKIFLEENAKILPFLINKLKEGDTSVIIIISKISRISLDFVYDKENKDTDIIKFFLNWWEKDEKEIIEEFKKYLKAYKKENRFFSFPRYEITEPGKKILSLGIAILPYIIENIEKDYSEYKILILILTNKNFAFEASQKLDKNKPLFSPKVIEDAIKEWWEENKSYWILSKSKEPPKEK